MKALQEAGNTPLNTIFILPSLTAGGAERVLINLMNGVDREHFAPTLVTVSSNGELRDLVSKDIPYHSLNKNSVLKSTPNLYKLLKTMKPDIIVSTMAHMNFAVMALKPFFPKTTFIIREAITPSFLFEKYKGRSFIIKNLYKQYYPKADVILSPAQIIFDEFSDELQISPDNFELLRNPVNLAKMRAQDNFRPISEERKKTVNFVAAGRLGEQKGFDRLIEKLADFTMPYAWNLTIYGEGTERAYLEALIECHGLKDKVKLPGLVKGPYKEFAQADCFVLPSRFEGLPNVVLESLACGTPVIGTQESGGIGEIAKDVPEAHLSVVSSMDEFMSKMAIVQPNPTEKFRPSLLPQSYEHDNVLHAFNKILYKATGIELVKPLVAKRAA